MTEDWGVLIHLYVYLGKRTVKGAWQGPQHGSKSIHLQPLGEGAPREEGSFLRSSPSHCPPSERRWHTSPALCTPARRLSALFLSKWT